MSSFITKSHTEKRATRIQPSQVALLSQLSPKNEGVSQSSDPKWKSGNYVPSSHSHLTKIAPSSPPEPGGKTIKGAPRASNSHADSDFNVRNESPWDTYKKYYECDLAGKVFVCVRASDGRAAQAIRSFSNMNRDRILKILRSTNHKNVASVRECFCISNSFFTVSEFDPLSLDHIVACKAFPDQQQLAAIMSQVCAPNVFEQND